MTPYRAVAKRDDQRATLRGLTDWEPYLRAHSGLPGPRANLELAQAVADEGDLARFERLLAWDPTRAPTNSPDEFLALCGVIGLGRLVAEGHWDYLPALRTFASDPRWRIREGVAMALQRVGAWDMSALLAALRPWATGQPYEQRAAAAALCEPALLRDPAHKRQVLDVLDGITASLAASPNTGRQDERTLAQGLAYCWSVAVAALPGYGKPLMERWLASDDPTIARLMRENLKKQRLVRLDSEWVAEWLNQPRIRA